MFKHKIIKLKITTLNTLAPLKYKWVCLLFIIQHAFCSISHQACGTNVFTRMTQLTNLSIIHLSILCQLYGTQKYIVLNEISKPLPSQGLVILAELHTLSGHLWTGELNQKVWNMLSGTDGRWRLGFLYSPCSCSFFSLRTLDAKKETCMEVFLWRQKRCARENEKKKRSKPTGL